MSDGVLDSRGPAPWAQAEMLAEPAPRRPAMVLIVDDEPAVRRLVDTVLRGAGYRTMVATSPSAALALASALGAPDILVTDLKMPEMNGDQLAQRLRTAHPGVKVLYLTGFSHALFEYRPFLWENEQLLDKPFSIAGLLSAVADLND